MANPASQLESILTDSRRAKREAVIESISGSTVVVRTSKGRREVAAAGSTTYKIGDRVRMSGDIIVGKVSTEAAPVYYV